MPGCRGQRLPGQAAPGVPAAAPGRDGQLASRCAADWVGNAVPLCDEQTQKKVIEQGFGDNIVRSVPPMGVRQFDEDAREIGKVVIDTRQTSGGFRKILQEHVPTTRESRNPAQPAHGHRRRGGQEASPSAMCMRRKMRPAGAAGS